MKNIEKEDVVWMKLETFLLKYWQRHAVAVKLTTVRTINVKVDCLVWYINFDFYLY